MGGGRGLAAVNIGAPAGGSTSAPFPGRLAHDGASFAAAARLNRRRTEPAARGRSPGEENWQRSRMTSCSRACATGCSRRSWATCSIGWAHRRQFLPQAIRPLRPDMKLVGRAMPVLEADIFDDRAGSPGAAIAQAVRADAGGARRSSRRARSMSRPAARFATPSGANSCRRAPAISTPRAPCSTASSATRRGSRRSAFRPSAAASTRRTRARAAR